jgi:urease accessory protein
MRLDFACASEGRTLLSESFQEPPLKVVRAFALKDGSALAHLHNVSGGLLGGDHLSLQINVGRGASAQITTTGATRIYHARQGFYSTTQRNDITVGEGGLLEYLPDAIIPFAGADFFQRTTIDLSEGAGMFWWEILAPGREASGELFAYKRVEMRTRVNALGRRIACENICVQPGNHNVTSLARFGGYRYSATLYICRIGMDPSYWRTAEDHVREVTRSLTQVGETIWGISTLAAHGLVVRSLAHSGRGVLEGLQAVWRRAKMHLYDREAILPRKVN